jgi:hypothetical protein
VTEPSTIQSLHQQKPIKTKSNGNRFSWMIACLCRAMSLDQDDETIYADFNADAYKDLN